MGKKIFEDMVRIKRERGLSSQTSAVDMRVPKKSPRKKIIERVVEPELPEKKPKMVEISYSNPEEQKLIYDTVSSMGEEEVHDPQKSSRLMWSIATISIFFLLFSISYFFARAKITMVPLQKDAVLEKDFYAVLDSATALPFDLVALEGEDEVKITAGERKEVALPAKGTVIIYNDFSSAPQVLDIDTRLEGTNGKIYKTDKKITVPGKKADGTPGSIEVGVYAGEAGSEYNTGPMDFTIFGFKGGPKYDKFYARSKGDITGGLEGFLPTITELQKVEALTELKISLEKRLLSKAKEQIPEGFILFKDAVFLEVTKEEVDLNVSGEEVPVRVSGTLYGFLFEKDKLSSLIAEHVLTEEETGEVYIPNLDDLNFSLLIRPESFREVKNINFKLAGNLKVVWIIDENAIVEDMLGKKKKEFEGVLRNYPNIDSADLVLSPFWRTSVPDKLKRVKTVVNYPEE